MEFVGLCVWVLERGNGFFNYFPARFIFHNFWKSQSFMLKVSSANWSGKTGGIMEKCLSIDKDYQKLDLNIN